jgi:hypothetical protein
MIKKLNARDGKDDLSLEFEEAAKHGKMSALEARRADLARKAVCSLNRCLIQLEAAISRNESKISITICGDVSNSFLDFTEICKTIAKSAYKEAKYWKFHAERLIDLDSSTKAKITRLFVDFDAFAGDVG